MTVSALFPSLWSARITYFATQFSAFLPNATRQWEGEAVYGNTVKIPTVDRSVTISDYSHTADLAAAEDIDATTQDLSIDQEKSFHFFLEDLDARQSRIPGASLIDIKSQGAGLAMAANIDAYVAGRLAALDTSDILSAPAAASFNLNFVADLDKLLTINKYIQSQWIMIMPPELVEKIDDGIIAKTYGDAVLDRYFMNALGNDPAAGSNGFVFNLKRHPVYVSDALFLRRKADKAVTARTDANQSAVWCYNPLDLALVMQVNRTETYRPEKRFSTAVKGLFNYGAKVLNEERMVRFLFND